MFFTYSAGSAISESREWLPEVQFFSLPNSEIISEEITDVFVDQEGYVWVLTFGSIIKFDGKNFSKVKTNNIPHGSFLRIKQNENGDKYVIDYHGQIFYITNGTIVPHQNNYLLRQQNKTNVYHTIDVKSDSSIHFSFAGNSNYSVISPEGEISNLFKKRNLNIQGLVFVFREEQELPFAFGGKIRKAKYEGRENGNYVSIFNSKWEFVDSTLHSKVISRHHHSMVRLPNDNILLSTGKGELIEFNDSAIIKQKKYPDPILRLFADDDGLWISTKGKGIHYYESHNVNYEERHEILKNTTSVLAAKDYQGGLWLYSNQKGLGYIANKNVTFLSKSKGKDVKNVECYGDSVFFSIDENLFIMSYQNNKTENIIERGLNYEITDILHDSISKIWWVATRGVVSGFKNGRVLRFPLKQIYHSSGGRVKLTNSIDDKGSLFYGKVNWTYFSFDKSGIKKVSKKYPFIIYDILDTKKGGLLSTSNGLYRFKDNEVSVFSKKSNQIRTSVDQMLEFDNKIWLSYKETGVFFNGKERLLSLRYNQNPVLEADLVKENKEILWLISPEGTFEVKKDSIRNLYSIAVNRALPKASINELVTNGKEIFFGTNNKGLGKVSFQNIRKAIGLTPLIYVTEVKAGNKVYHKNFDIGEINYNKRDLGIWFHGIDYQNSNLQYRYKLNGHTNKWEFTTEGYVNYSALPAGDYTFDVQAKFGHGSWSHSKSVSFNISPPLWQKWWFILLLSISIIAVIYGIVKQKIRAIQIEKNLTIQKLEAEQKALRAQMNPHFVSNIVSSVQYLILDGAYKTANDFLTLFSNITRKVFNYSSEDYILLKDEIDFLSEYVKIEQIRFESRLNFEVKIDQTINPDKELIPPFLIQPILENAIVHGLKEKKGDKRIEFTINRKDDFLIISVFDNGVGIPPKGLDNQESDSKEKHSLGILKERIKIINQTNQADHISYETHKSDKGVISGTTVTLKIKSIKV